MAFLRRFMSPDTQVLCKDVAKYSSILLGSYIMWDIFRPPWDDIIVPGRDDVPPRAPATSTVLATIPVTISVPAPATAPATAPAAPVAPAPVGPSLAASPAANDRA